MMFLYQNISHVGRNAGADGLPGGGALCRGRQPCANHDHGQGNRRGAENRAVSI